MGGSQRGGFAGCFMLLLSRRWYYEYRIFADRLKKAGFSDLPFRVCDRMLFRLVDGPEPCRTAVPCDFLLAARLAVGLEVILLGDLLFFHVTLRF